MKSGKRGTLPKRGKYNECGENRDRLPYWRERDRKYAKTEERVVANRKHRAKHNATYRIVHHDRVLAVHAVHCAVKTGKLIRSPICQLCWVEGKRIQAHHQDYSKKLDVVWLCTMCHGYVHGRVHVEELLFGQPTASLEQSEPK